MDAHNGFAFFAFAMNGKALRKSGVKVRGGACVWS
jgi:hypothetical protein